MSQHVARKKHFMNFVVILANFLNGAGYFQMAQIVFQMAQNLRHLRPYIWLCLARSVPKPLLIELREAGGHQPGTYEPLLIFAADLLLSWL